MASPYDPDLKNICFNILASELHSPVLIARISSFLEKALSKIGFGGARVGPYAVTDPAEAETEGCRALYIILATGGTEHIARDIIMASKGKPAIIAAQPYANSLPSLLEISPLLESRAAPVYIPSLNPSDKKALARLEASIRGLWAASNILGSRIALIGMPSPWLVFSKARDDGLSRLSIRLIKIDPIEFSKEVLKAKPPREMANKVISGGEIVELAEGEPEKSLRIYSALKELSRKLGFKAVSPACWWFYKETGANACLAHTLLNDEGVVVGCEGDIPATISMTLLTYASGQPAFFANPAQIEGDNLLLAHCTAPLSLGKSYKIRKHFITGGSVTLTVEFKEGEKVTVARLDPSLSVLRAGVGTIVDGSPDIEFQCESRMLIKMPGAEVILEESIGNHYVATYGDHLEALKIASRILGVDFEPIS